MIKLHFIEMFCNCNIPGLTISISTLKFYYENGLYTEV